MTSRPSTTLISCRGAEKRLLYQHTFGRSTNWTRVFVEMNLASVPDFETNLCLDKTLRHPSNHHYIENSWNAAFGSHGISKLGKQKLLSITKVKTSFDSFFRVEKVSQWCRLFDRFHAIGVWTPKTIGRASRASTFTSIFVEWTVQKWRKSKELIA